MLKSLKPNLVRGFTNYVDKKRWVGSPKKLNFCQRLYDRKCQRKGVGGQKRRKNVVVVCERPLNQGLLKQMNGIALNGLGLW